MNTIRTEPRVHCWQRPMQGGYVPAASTNTDYLASVFAAERARLASAAKPRRRRRRAAAGEQQTSLLLAA